MADEWHEWLGKKVRTLPIYPRLDMRIHHIGTVKKFQAETGITQSAYHKLQTGVSDPKKSTIDTILRYTGLTYEQAFGEAGKRA